MTVMMILSSIVGKIRIKLLHHNLQSKHIHLQGFDDTNNEAFDAPIQDWFTSYIAIIS